MSYSLARDSEPRQLWSGLAMGSRPLTLGSYEGERMSQLLRGFLALPLIAVAQDQTEFFENRIRPVLAQQCFACHTNSKMAGLRLDSRDDMLKGGKSGPALVPGEPDKSLLITAIRQTTEIKMPKGGARLTDPQLADLTA